MSVLFFVLAFVIVAAGVWFCAPLMHRSTAQLPVLFIHKVGIAPAYAKDKKNWISPQKLEKLFQALKKGGITPLLPSQIKKALFPHSLLLVFGGGYETFYTVVFPLLKKYNLPASVVLSVAQIGQYDAWQNPQTGPWQNILTKEEIKELAKSGLVEFTSTTLKGTSLNMDNDEEAIWQLVENKHRLLELYNIKTSCVYYPPPHLPRPAVQQALNKQFALSIACQRGHNPFPLKTGQPLYILPISAKTSLLRLCWKIR